MSARRALAALLTVTAVAWAAPAAVAQPSSARPSADGDGVVDEAAELRGARDGVALHVADFTGAVSPDGSFRLRLRVANRARVVEEGLRVVATFHRRAFHRLDFARAVDDGRVGDVYTSLSEELAPLPGRRVRTVELRRTAAELGFARGEDALGVYPLVVRLQRDDETLQTVRTAVVVVSSQVAQPLRTAMIVPVDAPPVLLPGGRLHADTLRQDLAPRGRLRSLLSELGGRPDVPVTFAVDARLLDDAADIADGYLPASGEPGEEVPATAGLPRAAKGFLDELRTTLAQPHVETVALPYGPADLSALVRGGMGSEATRLVVEGRRRVEAHSQARPSPAVLLPADGISPPALSEVVTAGVDTVLLDGDALQPDGGASTASPTPVRRLRTATGTALTAAVPDPWLAELLADEARLEDLDPAVAVQRLVAETAAVYFERPFAERPRGLLLLPPLHWDPPEGVAVGLAGALRAAPWLRATTLAGLVAQIAPPDGVVRLVADEERQSRELPRSYVRELRESRRALGSLAGVLAGDAATPARFDRMLLSAASVWYRDDLADGLGLMREVVRTVADLYQSVRVVDSPTVLLSGLEGQIPVTVENTSPISLRLAIRLRSQRFAFDDGPVRTVVVEPGATQTVAFQAHDRSPGATSPIQVEVADADGQLVLAEGTLVVRSTAVSAAALAVVIGAGLFLLLWWLRTFRRRRTQARRAAAVDEAA